MSIKLVIASVTLAATAFAALPAGAQQYPDKTVRLIVGRPPGGVADIAARIVGQKLTERWQQQVIVDNRPGGSGLIAVNVAAQAPADGYTLLVSADSDITINRFVLKNWKPYIDEALIPVIRITTNPVVIVANAKASFNTVQELISAAKAKPGAITFATAGIGSNPHLIGEYFARRAGVTLKHIAYKGGSEAAVAAAGGETVLAVMAVSSAVPHVKSGRLKVIGLSTARRLPFLPDWPTIAEGGLPDFESNIWTALHAPRGTPPAVLEKLRADVGAVLKDPAVVAQFEAVGAEATPLAGDDLQSFIKREIEHHRSLVGSLQLTVN